jgi:hypothetical protein
MQISLGSFPFSILSAEAAFGCSGRASTERHLWLSNCAQISASASSSAGWLELNCKLHRSQIPKSCRYNFYDSKIALRHGSPFRLRVLRLGEGQTGGRTQRGTCCILPRLAQFSPAARALVGTTIRHGNALSRLCVQNLLSSIASIAAGENMIPAHPVTKCHA